MGTSGHGAVVARLVDGVPAWGQGQVILIAEVQQLIAPRLVLPTAPPAGARPMVVLCFQIPLAPPAPHAEELNEPSPNKGGHMGFVVVIVVCGQQVHSCIFLVG